MHKIVAGAFRAIALSVIFIIVWDVGFYLFRAYSLNQKIESIMVTMQDAVSKNNYLDANSYKMYENILKGIATDMNGNDSTEFVLGYRLNYSHPCDVDTSGVSGLTFSKQLNTPADYGDIAVIELKVTINAVDWFYDTSANGAANEAQRKYVKNTLTYTYQVPCLRYISMTE